MIETLRIVNLALVDEAQLEFGPGLNVLTGETGAGKSIVLGALALLAGARASARSVGSRGDESVVEAVFRTDGVADLERELARRGLAGEDHELVVRRSLGRNGRSRARVSGQLLPVSLLAELLGGRLEISSQHDSQGLLRPEVHGLLLDHLGELLPLRGEVEQGFRRLRALDEERARLRADVAERMRRRDFLAFQVEEIDAAGLDPGEVAGLRAERTRRAHAERLRAGGRRALAELIGDPLDGDAPGAADLLAGAARSIAELTGLDPSLAPIRERLDAATADLRDAAADVERYVDGIEADPARLAACEERLHAVEALQRKYGESVEAVLAFRARAAAELSEIDGADERGAELDRERGETAEHLEDAARRLSQGRERAGKRLSGAVQSSLRELAMPHARFSVALRPAPAPAEAPCGPGGRESPEFQFTANRGEPLQPLRKVASGGELSRAFLAIKQATRAGETGMVLVFDEVDAGIGGEAADRVGRRLAELAASHQVLCITHLPQIAAFASTHFRVEKRSDRRRTVARVERVEGAARVEEIARMAGGEAIGEATREHARSLLQSRAPAPDPC